MKAMALGVPSSSRNGTTSDSPSVRGGVMLVVRLGRQQCRRNQKAAITAARIRNAGFHRR